MLLLCCSVVVAVLLKCLCVVVVYSKGLTAYLKGVTGVEGCVFNALVVEYYHGFKIIFLVFFNTPLYTSSSSVHLVLEPSQPICAYNCLPPLFIR